MNATDNIRTQTSANRTFAGACAASCQKLVGRLQSARESLQAEFQQRWGAADRAVRLALNEAEALAFESGFPLLVFPTLAREKAEAVVSWDRRQRAILGAAAARPARP